MGRSKKNWDHLVDYFGNYGIDIANGIFPGGGNTPGIKGNKGELGFTGPKGTKGDKGNKGLQGYGKKGDKGLTGPDGGKGEKGGPGGLFTFKGTITDESQLPPNAEPGDVYFNTTTGDLFAFDSNEWLNVGGIPEPARGDKGEQGDIGQKGEPGVDGNPGASGVTGDKGEPGEDYDPLVLDDYYPKDQIDAMIEHHHPPEFAFNVSYYKDTTSIVANEAVNFFSNDHQDELYNPGIVVLESNCTITDSPITSGRQFVVNYVVDDAGRARGLGYQLIQYVHTADRGVVDDAAYWRIVRPASSDFGQWHKANFDEENYYNKTEIDDITSTIGDQGLVFVNAEPENTEQLVLQDKNGAIDPTFVRFHTTGGITLTRNGNRLTFDGSPLAGQLLFLGLLAVDEDVTVTVPDPEPGNYFIFRENGTDVNTGETVAIGDWLIYGEDPQEWRHLPMGVSYGVAEVRIKGEKPYMTKTGAIQFPELGFDTPEFERDFPGREGAIDIMNGSIWNLNDVKSDYIRNYMIGYSGKVDWNATLASGQYAVNIAEGKIRLSDRTDKDASTEDFLDSVMDNPGFFMEATSSVRSGGVADRPTIVSVETDGFVCTFANRSVPMWAANESGGLLILTLCPDRDDIYQGQSLVWNNAEQKFIPAYAGEGTYVKLEGDTMEGDLDMDGNDLNGLANPPATDSSAVSKEWVLEQLSQLRQVPVGAIMFWASSRAIPQGWLKMDGSSFNVGDNPILHNILSGFKDGYTSGRTPNWGGRFTFQTTGASSNLQENGGSAGQFTPQRTADSGGNVKIAEDEGKHKHQWVRQGGTGAGTSTGSNVIRDKNSGAKNSKVTYYTDTDVTHEGQHNHNLIDWDGVTRPNSVAGYWIIKAG